MVNFKNLLETYRNIGTKESESLFSDFDRKINIVVKKTLTEFSSFYLLAKNKLPIYSEQFTCYVTYLASQGKSFFKEQINKISNLYKFCLNKLKEYRLKKVSHAIQYKQLNLLKLFLTIWPIRQIQDEINTFSFDAIKNKDHKIFKILIETNVPNQQARGMFIVHASAEQNIEAIKIVLQAGTVSNKLKEQAIKKAQEKGFTDILAILKN